MFGDTWHAEELLPLHSRMNIQGSKLVFAVNFPDLSQIFPCLYHFKKVAAAAELICEATILNFTT